MPENEFEKQVKELMEQFDISPSEPVWEKIRKRIIEKKRRVWPVFFLLASVAILSGYFFYTDIKHTNHNVNKTQQPVNAVNSKQDLSNNKQQKKKNTVADSELKQSSNTEKTSEEKHGTLNAIKNNKAAFTHSSSLINKKINKLNDKTLPENSLVKIKTAKQSNNTGDEINIQQPAGLPVANNNTANKGYDTSDKENLFTNKQPVQQNTVSTNIQSNNDLTSVANNTKIKTDTSAIVKEVATNAPAQKNKTTVKKSNNSKWFFGVTGMYGRSNITDKITSININNDKSLSSGVYLNNPGTVLSNNSISLKNPYSTGSAYNFGLVVQRKISRKSAINTGVSFVYLSSKNTTAISVDSFLIPVVRDVQSYTAASNFYRVGTTRTYVNHFNFIEIPLTFQSNIFELKNFSLVYNAGFSVMQLLSSKSLIYNNKNNNFFSDNSLIKHTQFQLNAGLNFQLHTNAGNFLLGPNLEYSLSPYLKTNDYNRLHFINYGIHASWLFNKK